MKIQQDIQKGYITEHEVSEYLRQHLEFFEANTQLLGELKLPHNMNGAVSLVERQITVLRDKNRQLRAHLHDLIKVARENDSLNQRLHHLILELLQTKTLEQVIDCWYGNLLKNFSVDAIGLRLFAKPLHDDCDGWQGRPEFVARNDPSLTAFAKLIKEGKPVCGRLVQQQQCLFDHYGGDHAKKIGSVVILPLLDKSCFGLMALGSNDTQRFHPGKGMAFLQQLAELISWSMISYLSISKPGRAG